MTSSKTKSPSAKSLQAQTAPSGDIDPKHVGKEAPNSEPENIAQATMGRVKEAIPSLDDIASSLKHETNIDVQSMADDATTFVRRNPAASIAAAAGIGILIGVLASKRS